MKNFYPLCFIQIAMRRYGHWATLMLAVVLLQGCFQNYYRAATPATDQNREQTLRQAINDKRYFILHMGSSTWSLSAVQLDGNGQLKGVINTVAMDHQWYTSNTFRKWYKRNNLISKNVLSEVHLYTNEESEVGAGMHYTLPLKSISEIRVIKKDEVKSVASHVGGVVFLSVFALVAAFAMGAFGFPG